MTPEEDDWDEALYSSLIHSTSHDMPPPDPDFLSRLRERSTQAFLEAAGSETGSPPAVPAAAASAATDRIPPTSPARAVIHPPRKRSMLIFKALSAFAAAAVVVAAGIWSFFGPHETQMVFGAALDRVAAAETLHLKITRDGEAGEVWYAQPNRLRWDAADGTYKIARGDTLWRVDESQNLAASEPAALFGTDAARRPGVDLLALLAVDDPEARSSLAALRPVETIERDGRKLLHYHFTLPARTEPLTLDAIVDLKTEMVESFAIGALRNGLLQPVAELNVLAVNAPVAEEKFVVRDTLTEDGRVGKVVDVQGLVSLKPVMHSRWTALCGKTLLKPGDWVRTDNRGANAATLKIVKQSQVILGPASLVEIVSPVQIRVHSGEFEVTAGEKDSLELVGPDGEKVAIEGTQIFRVTNDKLARLEKEPLWLKGFKGTENAESIGSLIAKVDGRAVPLTVGYHKVTVDIRDQIARTVIEESFVNHTNGILEGVFYFPLPDDASISGFGMWIGDELVEADVVEKQRAREIYETIKHEKRDPGLLEWSGGNLFKASVYPITPNSEKRIKISYTQVLPARGNTYRYSYALQSDLLKLNPLRELSIDLKLHSAVPLKNISSPTHTVRADRTDHSGHIEFAAQDYTPTRDFEVVVETDGRQSDVVVIPHRRGEDGYFMLQLTPPATGDWQREVVPDGEPLQLLILADTSASMDAGQRKRQQEVVAALLAGLTPRDTVNLAGCDVECDWVFEKPQAVEPKTIASIRSFLEQRHSLGWTNLDVAFASAFKQSGPKTHIVYIGDGIVTTGDARPEGFAQRIKVAYGAAAGTCHAVALGSTFEPAVLKAIASLGSGSLRRVSGEERPPMVATALLREMAQPGLRDLKIEFRGLETARVYPEELPNVPVGSQQIVLGLYRPTGIERGATDQTGDVVVTATQNGKPVKFAAKFSLKDAEEGNSFIPRLWAKMHLDALLAQGAAPAIRDEVIALSEEFQIMTPYTSFLVLESDADRERFKVKRRFRMRDGEKYFQEGRDNASFELVQKQMQKAGNWRLGLRRMALRRLATLGRDAQLIQPPQPMWMTGPYGGPIDSFSGSGPITFGFASGFGGPGGGSSYFNAPMEELAAGDYTASVDGIFPALAAPGGYLGDERDANGKSETGFETRESSGTEKEMEAAEPAEAAGEYDIRSGGGKDGLAEFDRGESKRLHPDHLSLEDSTKSLIDFESALDVGGEANELGMFKLRAESFGRRSRFERYRRGWNQPDYVSWVNTLFPPLPPVEVPRKAKPPKVTWPDAARELSQSLLRTEKLAQLAGGLEIARESQGYEARWNELTSRQRRLDLYSKAAWLTQTEADSQQTLVNWADATERGVMSLAFGLGRIRKSATSDMTPAILDRADAAYLGLNDHSLAPLHETYRDHTPTIEPGDENRVLLVLKLPRAPKYETRIAIDTARHVILAIEQRNEGKVTARTNFDDFVEAAGCWWARRIEITDDAGRRTWLITQTVQPVAADAFAARLKIELAPREQVQFVHLPVPTVAEAKRAQTRLGRLTFDSQLVLLLHFAQSQQWERVFDQLEKCEKLAAGKPGARWLRSAVLSIGRRHEELRAWLTEEAAQGSAGAWKLPGHDRRDPQATSGDELFLAGYVAGQGGNVLEAGEQMRLHNQLKPVYERQPAYRQALKGWKERRVNYLQMTGQPDAALGEMKQLASEFPRDWNLQQRYARMLHDNSDFDAAYAWLNKTLADNAGRLPYEEDNLRGTYAGFLQQQGRYAELAGFCAQWIERSRENSSVYQQYLSALIQADQVAKADALMAEWLKAGAAAGELPAIAAARLSGAVWVALGQGYFIYSDRVEEKWQAPLAEVVLAAARSDRDLSLANQIMGHWRFQQTDECRRARREIARLLTADADKTAPDRLQQLISWIMPNDPAVPQETWQAIAKALEARWSAEKDPEMRHQLAAPLVQVLAQRIGTSELLAFLRRQLAEGPEPYRAAYAHQLFNALLSEPWSAPVEDEAFALLERLSDAEEPDDRLSAQVAALYRLTDAMVAARNRAGLATIEHIEQLKRNERREKTDEQLRLARQGFADRLKQEMSRRQGALVSWLNIERLYLDTLTQRNLPQVAEECWEALPSLAVSRPVQPDDADDTTDTARRLQRALRSRYLATLMHLATRKGADAELSDRLLKFIDQKLAAEAEAGAWKALKYALLLALDRPKELKETLTAWMQADDDASRWRLSLGYLLAELGSVPEAIALLEGIEVADELGPQAYAVLADWYLAANRRDAYERARIRVYETLDENQMNQWLYRQLSPWQRTDGHLPGELDAEVILMYSALFQKSNYPQNYLTTVQQFYRATHDFRLLAVLARSVVGHSAAKVYPFVLQMQQVLTEIRDEAVADQLRDEIAKVRATAKTAVDRRALEMLEVQVERRAAEVQNQAGPHVAAALAALQRAFQHEWTAGEQRLMADFLSGLGTITPKSLADEQLRQLRALYDLQERGTYDRLHIGAALAGSLWNYGRPAEATDLLQGALAEFQQAGGGVLPVSANNALATFVYYLNSQRHYARAEKIIGDQLRHPVHGQQRLWLIQNLYNVYNAALQNDGEISLGSGKTLYKAFEQALLKDLDTGDHNHRYNVVNQLCALYRLADAKKLAGTRDDLMNFATKVVPGVLKLQTSNYTAVVNQVAATLHDVIGVRAGLAFLIERLENEPGWLRYNNQDGWSQFASTLHYWRFELKNLGDLEGRFLAIVLAALRRDLESHQARQRLIYFPYTDERFWKEKINDFVRVAEEVYAERKKSGAAVQYIADYLYYGLHHNNRAIEILFIAHRDKVLDEAGRAKLVDFLHLDNRFGESIALLEPLVEEHPANLNYRVWLMHACFRTNRKAELLAQLKESDEYFHKENRWGEYPLSMLAGSCLQNELYAECVKYYDELIPLHQQSQPNRGIGNGTLSGYYANQADAYAGLKMTAKAVEAACGAIISWGPTHANRVHAVEALQNVLRRSPDLAAYVAELDKETDANGEDRPIVRKALGKVLLEQGQLARAIAQLKRAVALEPNDVETHNALITGYDKIGDPEGALRQMLQLADVNRRDIAQFRLLGNRYSVLERPREAERAYTSVVEALPLESESHDLLATIRQQQNRWPEAIEQWELSVKLRSLEPTGLVGLAGAQIHEKQFDAARASVRKLQATTWPPRFGDVANQIRELEERLKAARDQ